jgi:hypothetical protein
MRGRLKEFSLSLHPDKTRLIEFGRFAVANRKRRGLGKPSQRMAIWLMARFPSGNSRTARAKPPAQKPDLFLVRRFLEREVTGRLGRNAAIT